MNNSHRCAVYNNYLTPIIKILAIAVFVIIISACSTTVTQERTLNIDASLMQPCPPLPLIEGSISLGEYILLGVDDSGMYNECRQSKQGLIDAINIYKSQ